jgi:hypothetical protein
MSIKKKIMLLTMMLASVFCYAQETELTPEQVAQAELEVLAKQIAANGATVEEWQTAIDLWKVSPVDRQEFLRTLLTRSLLSAPSRFTEISSFQPYAEIFPDIRFIRESAKK